VGFRPFVYRLADELHIRGWVRNDPQGVRIEAEGLRPLLHRFLDRVAAERPTQSRIHSVDADWLEPVGYRGFEIRGSDEGGQKGAVVLPDLASCPKCLAEVLDPADRRHHYPFANCTDCGPRFTIIEELPYDRPSTTMRRFLMCPDCAAEYEDPADRRFHAQPNACPDCGPQLELLDADGTPLAQRHEALARAAAELKAGAIVAVKGLGGFHLMADAANKQTVALLRSRKPRRDKPLALMVKDLAQAAALCELPTSAATLLASPEAPIVLLQRRAEAPVARNVAPHVATLGVMLPATPLHHLLLRAVDRPLVATSGNLSEEPICTDHLEATQRLGGVADRFLTHDRPIARHADDSIAWLVEGKPRLLRRARGYAPLPVRVKRELPTILAVGAHLKNTVALGVGRNVFLSQHIGDLETPQAQTAFERVIADFLELYEARPVAIAHDKHPDYLSTAWAKQQQVPLIGVQHHHAHLAACLAENQVDGVALGVTFDGTGYGDDHTAWGGEFLLGNAAGFKRFAHLRPFRLIGGDAAAREPRRAALALLLEAFGEEAWNLEEVARWFDPAESRVLAGMLTHGLNAPWTTSAGRLFDGVAALLGLFAKTTFEGQAAMALECLATPGTDSAYPVALRGEDPCVLDWIELLHAILDDKRRGIDRGIIAARFHNALVEAIVEVARRAHMRRVALTGGCFQNRRLTEQAARRLKEEGFQVLLHRDVPPNDGGISLGQVAVAAARIEREEEGDQPCASGSPERS